MIDKIKSGNATLIFNDEGADPSKKDDILYRIGEIHRSGLAEKMINKSKGKSTA